MGSECGRRRFGNASGDDAEIPIFEQTIGASRRVLVPLMETNTTDTVDLSARE